MYAIVETGGKQYRVKEGDVLFIEKIEGEAADTVEFDSVLAVSNDGDLNLGKPFVEGAKVKAEVLEQGKDKKIIVFKFRAKNNFRKKQGHRQPYTKIQVKEILA